MHTQYAIHSSRQSIICLDSIRMLYSVFGAFAIFAEFIHFENGALITPDKRRTMDHKWKKFYERFA